MSQQTRKDCWPAPHDPEHLFTKTLLLLGPFPPKGWSITRNPAGKVVYVTCRGREARKFQNEVIKTFTAEVKRRYAVHAWKDGHCHRIAQAWKNRFMLWVWSEIDERS